jgi:uncharacterized membrane protein
MEVRGNQAIAGTAAEATVYFRTRNIRWGISMAFLVVVIYYLCRRLRRPSAKNEP